MALNFPPNPQVGNTVFTGGKTWMWDGSRWNRQSLTANNLIVTGPFTANTSNGVAGQVLLTNGTGIYWGNTRFDTLEDVIEGTPSNGHIVTYISSLDKYQVLPLSVADTALSNTSMDGGTF